MPTPSGGSLGSPPRTQPAISCGDPRAAAAVLVDAAWPCGRGRVLIDVDEHVMDDLAVARDDLEAGQEHVLGVAGIEADAVEEVELLACGLDGDRRGHGHARRRVLQVEIGRLGQRRGEVGIALGRANVGPVAEQLDLVGGQPRIMLEAERRLALRGLQRVPRGHVAGLDGVGHQRGPGCGLLVGHHRERSDAAVDVAALAGLGHERGHVFVPVGAELFAIAIAVAGWIAVAGRIPVAVARLGLAVALGARGIATSNERERAGRSEQRDEQSSHGRSKQIRRTLRRKSLTGTARGSWSGRTAARRC
jgi:hypothetical protein